MWAQHSVANNGRQAGVTSVARVGLVFGLVLGGVLESRSSVWGIPIRSTFYCRDKSA